MNIEGRREFWRWFEVTVLPGLANDELPPDEIVAEMDERLRIMGVSWELGPAPDGSDDWGLAISFGGDPDKISLAMLIVNAARAMPRCQVLVGKPPKEWDGELELYLQSRWWRFSTASWMCYVQKMRQGVALFVAPVGVEPGVDSDLVAEAVNIAVQSELGELVMARHVRSISVWDLENEQSPVGTLCKMSDLGASLQAMGVVT